MDPYRKVTQRNILRKVNRKRHPVTSLVQLANEFGINTTHTRSNGKEAHIAPRKFRNIVITEVGAKAYNNIRDSRMVRAA